MIQTAEILNTWETQGYITELNVLSALEIPRYRSLFDQLELQEGKSKTQIGLVDRHFDVKFVWELASHPVVLEHVKSILGPDVLLLATHFFCKYPAQGDTFVAWHQDVTYWGLEPPFAITAWLAIDDADRENGCMRVIPASHSLGILDHDTSAREGNLLSSNQEIPDSMINAASAVDLELKAGQMSLHHGQLIHGSNPNRSQRRRCGLTVRFVPPYVQQVKTNSTGGGWHPVLVSGQDNYHHFTHERKPSFDL